MRALPFRWIPRGEPFQNQGNGSSGAIPAILEHLVIQRGLPMGADLESFLRPRLRDLADPFLIPGMRDAVERILLAADRKESVCIYGDYDVDGVTSITLMRRILRSYGLEPRHFIPRRGPEGYGLSVAALKRCMEEGPKPDLLVTVDCGTVSIDEVAMLRSQGVDVVIVDHHEPLPDARPTPFSPPSGQATGSFNGLHTESKFLAAKHLKSIWTTAASWFSNTPEDPGRLANKPPPK